MKSPTHLAWPGTTAVSLLAGLATWVVLWSWSGLVEDGSGYLVPAIMACLLVAVTGMLLRSARVHVLIVPLGQLVVLLLWLNRTWARDLAWGGWLPTPSSLRELADRVAGGFAAAQAYAAPVPETIPVIFALLIVGAAGVAVTVDFLACGLRRVPLAGLPLLAVYTVPVSILAGGVAWWVFAAGAIAFLSLLGADEAQRLASWGRQISGSPRVFDSVGTTVSTQAVRASARKIGLTATGLAVVVPIFIPTLSASLFGGGGPGGGGGGDSVSISNPMADLRRDLVRGEDTDLVWVTTTDPDPSYLRLSVLDEFDGETWRPSGRDIPVQQRANGRLPRPPGLEPDVPRNEVQYEIEIGPELESRWLPAPYPTSIITTRGDWRYDTSTLDFISAADGQTTANADYSLQALKLQLSAEKLAASGPSSEDIFTPNTELPSSMPGFVLELTRSLTNDAPSRFEKAVVIQEWFREDGGFEYSTDRPAGNGVSDLAEFLGEEPDSRIGYCEQFAAAMAVMGRTIGIPSRVAVGFLRPQPVGGDTYVYSSHDLHAWPEMYFEGTGWIRFEPTPAARATAVPGYTSQTLPTDTPSEANPSDARNEQQNRFEEETQAPGAGNPDDRAGSGGGVGRSLTWLGPMLGVLALACVPRLLRSLVRRRRLSAATSPAAVAEAAWAELRDTTIDLGLAWDDSVTLRSRARVLVNSLGEPVGQGSADQDRLSRRPPTGPDANPDAAAALERLVKHVERARYARYPHPDKDVYADLFLCVEALRGGVSRKRRALADWLPASLLKNLGQIDVRVRRDRTAEPASELGVDHAV